MIPKTWLVTGCSTGLGRAIAEELINRGERVIATARRVEAIGDSIRDAANAHALQLDVTNPDEIRAAVARVEADFAGIDVLINNAGYGYIASAEEADEGAYRELFETNVFGLIAMTRAVLPGMRARRRGHIVNVSSIGGLSANPGSSFYAATKFAVIGFTQSLSKEVAHLGIKATVVLPGLLRTDWAGRSLKVAGDSIADYEPTVHSRIRGLSELDGNQRGDPARAAAAIIKALDGPEPPLHLVLGPDALGIAREQLSKLAAEFSRWEVLSASTDFA